ncbi:hypothetical protein QYF36_007356 [Acer negundo]|nr:hypothetical protein QYF36_007356 [Acer negundo]
MADSSSSESKLATAKTILTTAASVAGTVMLARSVARDFMPYEFQDYISIKCRKFYSRFSSQLTMVIDELDGFDKNQIYEAAQIYLSSKTSASTDRLRVIKREKENKINVTLEGGEEIIDTFNGVKLRWVLVSRQVESRNNLFNQFNGHGLNSSYRSEVRELIEFLELKKKEKEEESAKNEEQSAQETNQVDQSETTKKEDKDEIKKGDS